MIYTQITPLDTIVMYGAQLGNATVAEVSIFAAQQYLQQLESKAILSLVGAATFFYNTIVPLEQDMIKLDIYTEGHSQQQRSEHILKNLRQLRLYYDDPKYQNPGYIPGNVKDLLIKWWWMGYKQLPQLQDSTLIPGQGMTWNWFINDLKCLSVAMWKDATLNEGLQEMQEETFVADREEELPQLVISPECTSC